MATTNQIETLAKKIHGIRKAMGYATRDQIKEGRASEIDIIQELIAVVRNSPEEKQCSCGGFNYQKKGNSIKIWPDFSWRIKI